MIISSIRMEAIIKEIYWIEREKAMEYTLVRIIAMKETGLTI